MAPKVESVLPVSASFWSRADVQEALARRTSDGSRDVGALFRLVNRRTGTSQAKIGAAVGMEQGYVSKVMNGQRVVVSIDVLERIAGGLDMPDGARAVLGLAPAPTSSPTATDLAAGCSGNGDPRQRTFAGFADQAVTGSAFGKQLDLLRQGVTDQVAGTAMGTCSVEEWELTAAAHARATRYRPAALQLSDLANDVADLWRVLGSRQSVSSLRRVTRVAAQLAGLMSLTLIKLDERAASLRWARTAWTAANEVEDPSIQSWVGAQEAYAHYYAGEHVAAVNVARRAQAVGGRLPTVGAALAAALEARALAARGQADEARGALVRAELILARLPADCLEASAFGYNEAQLRFHAGSAFTRLHDTSRAWEAQKRALEIYPVEDYLDRALVQLDRADCLVHDGDVIEGACRVVDTLTDLTASQRAGMVAGRASELLHALPRSARSLSSAHDLRDVLMVPAGQEG